MSDIVFYDKQFVHGDGVAEWLNELAKTNTIVEWKMCPVGSGHGMVVVASCFPNRTNEELLYGWEHCGLGVPVTFTEKINGD